MNLKNILTSNPLGTASIVAAGLFVGAAFNGTQAQTVVNNNITGHAPEQATETTTEDPLYLLPEGADAELGTVDDQFYPVSGSPLLGTRDETYSESETGITGFAKEDTRGAYAPSAQIPVELTRLDARVDGGRSVVEWRTAQETNNAYFTLSEKLESGGFKALKQVPGAGTTSQPRSYRVVDDNVGNNSNPAVYTLSQVDVDGTTTHLGRVSVSYRSDEHVSIFPNPVSVGAEATLDIEGMTPGTYTIGVYDIPGRRVYTRQVAIAADEEVPLEIGSLASGTYLVRLQAEGKTDNTRTVGKIEVVR